MFIPLAFDDLAKVCSFACRTGLGGTDNSDLVLKADFATSLAQKIADSWDVTVSAFARRTDYSQTLGTTANRFAYKFGGDSKILGKSLKQRQNVDGADITPEGAVNGVKAGDTPKGVHPQMRTYGPQKTKNEKS